MLYGVCVGVAGSAMNTEADGGGAHVKVENMGDFGIEF
jgi:hypothetical protein